MHVFSKANFDSGRIGSKLHFSLRIKKKQLLLQRVDIGVGSTRISSTAI